MSRYVALGSSMAAGPGIRRRPRVHRFVRAAPLAISRIKEVGRTLRQHSPQAKVLFVDYLTLLPPPGIADTLERLTAEAAADTGCAVVRVAQASRDHHASSVEPWTMNFGFATAGSAGAATSQCRRHAGRRRTGRRAGVMAGAQIDTPVVSPRG